MAARETENLIVENAVAATVSAPRILVVEDNALIAMDLESIVQESGCEVVGPAATVKQAIEQIRRGPIDIAIVDYLLEDGTADRLARALDQRKIPFALCTGSDGGQLNVKFAGTPIVTKPYTQADIQGVIDTLVANRLADS